MCLSARPDCRHLSLAQHYFTIQLLHKNINRPCGKSGFPRSRFFWAPAAASNYFCECILYLWPLRVSGDVQNSFRGTGTRSLTGSQWRNAKHMCRMNRVYVRALQFGCQPTPRDVTYESNNCDFAITHLSNFLTGLDKVSKYFIFLHIFTNYI